MNYHEILPISNENIGDEFIYQCCMPIFLTYIYPNNINYFLWICVLDTYDSHKT